MIAFIKRKYINLVSDKKFSEILSGSAWALGARVAATAFGMITSIIIARTYGADMVGILAVIQAFLLFATIATVMGTNTSILRLIPEHITKYSVTSAFRVYRKTQYFIVTLSLVASLLLFIGADIIAEKFFLKPNLAFYIAFAACFVVFQSLMNLNAQAVRGLRLIKAYAWMQVLPAATFLLILVGLTLLDTGKDSPVYARMASLGIAAIAGVWIMYYTFYQRMREDDLIHPMPLGEILNISLPMLVTASMHFIIGQTGVILIGIFCSEAEVGYYAIAVKLATLTTFVLTAINSMAAPKFSELFHDGLMDELFHVGQKSTRLIFWTTMPVLILLLIFGTPVLGALFGFEFTKAYPAMSLLILGQFVNSISGSTGYFMQMTGHQKPFSKIMLTAGLLNIILGIALVPHYGILGAAVAAMICIFFWNIYTLFYIQKFFGKTIGYFPFLLSSR